MELCLKNPNTVAAINLYALYKRKGEILNIKYFIFQKRTDMEIIIMLYLCF
jgi:hypothetical protein